MPWCGEYAEMGVPLIRHVEDECPGVFAFITGALFCLCGAAKGANGPPYAQQWPGDAMPSIDMPLSNRAWEEKKKRGLL